MQTKAFFGSLFDISFDSFVTTRIAKVLYVIAIVLSALWTLGLLGSAFAADTGTGVVVLVLSPAIFLLLVIYSRVLLEFLTVVFRIYENTRTLRHLGGGPLAQPAGVPPAGSPGPAAPPGTPAPLPEQARPDEP